MLCNEERCANQCRQKKHLQECKEVLLLNKIIVVEIEGEIEKDAKPYQVNELARDVTGLQYFAPIEGLAL